MDVSIIIINYNTFDLTSDCIRSVIQFTTGINYEIILIDNASAECDPEAFLKKFPQLILMKSNINGGFAYGNNLGIERSKGQYVLLLNSDTILKENSIAKSIDHIKKFDDAGALGCRMIYPDGRVQYTARRFRSISWELLDLFRFVPWLMGYKKRSRLMLGRYFKCDESIECDWVNGAFFMFLKTIVDQLPNKKLDDRFFMYGEDQLWCERIKNMGFKIIFYSKTTIIHIGNASTDIKKQLDLRKLMMKRELEIMRLRKGKGIYYYSFAMIYGFKESIRIFFKLVAFKFSSKLMK